MEVGKKFSSSSLVRLNKVEGRADKMLLMATSFIPFVTLFILELMVDLCVWEPAAMVGGPP